MNHLPTRYHQPPESLLTVRLRAWLNHWLNGLSRKLG